jgi:hypothetical protein
MAVFIALGANVGQHNLQLSVGNVVSSTITFTITNPPPPSVATVTPPSAAVGKTVNLVITGTNFVPGAYVSISGSGVTPSFIPQLSSTWITVPVTVASNAAIGDRTLTVVTPGGTSQTLRFTVTSN